LSKRIEFDPYAMFEALERHRVAFVVVGGFARVVHGSGELTRGLDIVPSLRDENVRRLANALEELGVPRASLESLQAPGLTDGEPLSVETRAGPVKVVPRPWGTRGYDDFRIRANHENLGRGLRPQIAALVDLVRTLDASDRSEDAERLHRLRRMMELDRQLTRHRGLSLEL
jgi:hypothetical protein